MEGEEMFHVIDFLNSQIKRKRNASSVENSESGAAGQGALCHCNYCNKDITRKIHIKCVECPDFDLCIECFYVVSMVIPQRINHPYRVMEPRAAGCRTSADSAGARSAGAANSSSVKEIDGSGTGYYGADFLTDPERRLCVELRMPPTVYLKMQMQLSKQMIDGTVTSKSDAHRLFKMDTAKIDRVYDMLIRKGGVVLRIR